MTVFSYALTVFLWGTTWIAIKYQVGIVDPEASVLYRFALATVAMAVAMAAMGRLRPIGWRHQPYLVLMGLCLFCLNFLCFYKAAEYMVSGLMAVIFSAATLFNVFNAFLFHRRIPNLRTIAGILFGLLGLAGLFWRDLTAQELNSDALAGLGLGLLGTYLFSLANMMSARNQKAGLDVGSTNVYAMFYGACALAVIGLAGGVEYTFDPSLKYAGSLVYLAIPGSVVAFTAYLTVVGRIGPEKAGYMTVLFPLVALALSTAFEGYQWTSEALAGLLSILVGNLLVLSRKSAAAKSSSRPAAA